MIDIINARSQHYASEVEFILASSLRPEEKIQPINELKRSNDFQILLEQVRQLEEFLGKMKNADKWLLQLADTIARLNVIQGLTNGSQEPSHLDQPSSSSSVPPNLNALAEKSYREWISDIEAIRKIYQTPEQSEGAKYLLITSCMNNLHIRSTQPTSMMGLKLWLKRSAPKPIPEGLEALATRIFEGFIHAPHRYDQFNTIAIIIQNISLIEYVYDISIADITRFLDYLQEGLNNLDPQTHRLMVEEIKILNNYVLNETLFHEIRSLHSKPSDPVLVEEAQTVALIQRTFNVPPSGLFDASVQQRLMNWVANIKQKIDSYQRIEAIQIDHFSDAFDRIYAIIALDNTPFSVQKEGQGVAYYGLNFVKISPDQLGLDQKKSLIEVLNTNIDDVEAQAHASLHLMIPIKHLFSYVMFQSNRLPDLVAPCFFPIKSDCAILIRMDDDHNQDQINELRFLYEFNPTIGFNPEQDPLVIFYRQDVDGLKAALRQTAQYLGALNARLTHDGIEIFDLEGQSIRSFEFEADRVFDGSTQNKMQQLSRPIHVKDDNQTGFGYWIFDYLQAFSPGSPDIHFSALQQKIQSQLAADEQYIHSLAHHPDARRLDLETLTRVAIQRTFNLAVHYHLAFFLDQHAALPSTKRALAELVHKMDALFRMLDGHPPTHLEVQPQSADPQPDALAADTQHPPEQLSVHDLTQWIEGHAQTDQPSSVLPQKKDPSRTKQQKQQKQPSSQSHAVKLKPQRPTLQSQPTQTLRLGKKSNHLDQKKERSRPKKTKKEKKSSPKGFEIIDLNQATDQQQAPIHITLQLSDLAQPETLNQERTSLPALSPEEEQQAEALVLPAAGCSSPDKVPGKVDIRKPDGTLVVLGRPAQDFQDLPPADLPSASMPVQNQNIKEDVPNVSPTQEVALQKWQSPLKWHKNSGFWSIHFAQGPGTKALTACNDGIKQVRIEGGRPTEYYAEHIYFHDAYFPNHEPIAITCLIPDWAMVDFKRWCAEENIAFNTLSVFDANGISATVQSYFSNYVRPMGLGFLSRHHIDYESPDERSNAWAGFRLFLRYQQAEKNKYMIQFNPSGWVMLPEVDTPIQLRPGQQKVEEGIYKIDYVPHSSSSSSSSNAVSTPALSNHFSEVLYMPKHLLLSLNPEQHDIWITSLIPQHYIQPFKLFLMYGLNPNGYLHQLGRQLYHFLFEDDHHHLPIRSVDDVDPAGRVSHPYTDYYPQHHMIALQDIALLIHAFLAQAS